MARGAGGKGGGGKGGKGGKQTARSQNYLRQYGYPSSRELRREAEGTAGASVSSIHEVRQPFKRQAQSAKDFLAAVRSVLSETQGQVGAGYDQATSQQAALDAATQQRLAGLGLGVDSAGVQAASGARGDSATANLLSNAASAKAYAASQPGIAAGNTGVVLAGLRKQETDALATRRDQLRQSFFAALQNAQQNALAHASFNQASDQFNQNMNLQRQQMATQNAQFAQGQANTDRAYAEGVREFNITRKDAKVKAAAGGFTPLQIQTFHSDIYDSIQSAKAGIPAMGSHHQLHKGGPGGAPRWKLPPAPNGAPNEPGQKNSIFALYELLSNKYSNPALQPLILAELKAAYPRSTWNIFKNEMTGGGSASGSSSGGNAGNGGGAGRK